MTSAHDPLARLNARLQRLGHSPVKWSTAQSVTYRVTAALDDRTVDLLKTNEYVYNQIQSTLDKGRASTESKKARRAIADKISDALDQLLNVDHHHSKQSGKQRKKEKREKRVEEHSGSESSEDSDIVQATPATTSGDTAKKPAVVKDKKRGRAPNKPAVKHRAGDSGNGASSSLALSRTAPLDIARAASSWQEYISDDDQQGNPRRDIGRNAIEHYLSEDDEDDRHTGTRNAIMAATPSNASALPGASMQLALEQGGSNVAQQQPQSQHGKRKRDDATDDLGVGGGQSHRRRLA